MRGARLVEAEQVGEDFVVGEGAGVPVVGPAVGGGDGGVEGGVGVGEPGGASVVEVGEGADAVGVRHDQERRVLQRDGVLQGLGEGAVEVLLAALVFPGEAALAPHIGPALAARGLGGAFLEGEPVAFGVGGDGIILAQQAAAVDEMRLRGAALFRLDMAPLGDELLRRHALTDTLLLP